MVDTMVKTKPVHYNVAELWNKKKARVMCGQRTDNYVR
jgi:hypothetical protein